MSHLIQKVRDFLKLLLNTTKNQARALLYTLSPIQTAALCEIFFNIHKLPLTKQVIRELQKRKFLFKTLGDKSVTIQRKLALIQSHYKQVQSTLQLIKTEILSILD